MALSGAGLSAKHAIRVVLASAPTASSTASSARPPTEFPKMPIAIPNAKQLKPAVRAGHRAPLVSSGSLDRYPKVDLTPAIGTEFRENWLNPEETVQLKDWLDDEDKIRDLAVLMWVLFVDTGGEVLWQRIHLWSVLDDSLICSAWMASLGHQHLRPSGVTRPTRSSTLTLQFPTRRRLLPPATWSDSERPEDSHGQAR